MTIPANAPFHERLIAASILFLLLAGCTTAPVTSGADPPTDQQLLSSLADGTAQLTKLTVFSGYSVAMSEALAASNLRGLYDTRNWQSLAVEVLKIGSGSDLSWFYLGRAAEELGYTEAARDYYRRSVEAAAKKGISGCLGAACSGFDFPTDSLSRIDALDLTVKQQTQQDAVETK